jgi:hypothetical protein
VTSEPVLRRAERARTTLASAPVLSVAVDGRGSEDVGAHAVDADGSLVLLVPADGMLGTRTGCGAAVATVHAARLLPLAVPDRAVDQTTAYGRVGLAADVEAALDVLINADPGRSAQVVLREDASALLRLDVVAVRVDGDPVDPEEYAAAEPDRIALACDATIAHLLRCHAEEMVELAHLLDPELLDAAWTVAPVLVDRWGVTFHVGCPTRTVRVRADFPEALRGPEELSAAMQALQRRAAHRRRPVR